MITQYRRQYNLLEVCRLIKAAAVLETAGKLKVVLCDTLVRTKATRILSAVKKQIHELPILKTDFAYFVSYESCTTEDYLTVKT